MQFVEALYILQNVTGHLNFCNFSVELVIMKCWLPFMALSLLHASIYYNMGKYTTWRYFKIASNLIYEYLNTDKYAPYAVGRRNTWQFVVVVVEWSAYNININHFTSFKYLL